MNASLIIAPAQMVYMNIPAKELRNFVDGMFPSLAVNPLADSAKGFGHRYVAGHDLLLDVPKTFTSHGSHEGLRHAGHILLTDFPTKAGIPIPLFSHSGLGKILEDAGIHRGWLQISFFDSTVGIMAIAESSTDLMQAINGSLTMNWGTFFDTFVDGSITAAFGVATSNPLLMAAGIQNICAGLVATYNQLTVYVDPLEFFGAAGISALVGFGMAYGLASQKLSDASINAIRSGTVSALFHISLAFGFGALAGFASYRIGCTLAEKHNKSMNTCFSLNQETYQLLVDEICKGNIAIQKLLDSALYYVNLQEDAQVLPSQPSLLKTSNNLLLGNIITLSTNIPILRSEVTELLSEQKTLPDDPSILIEWYKSHT